MYDLGFMALSESAIGYADGRWSRLRWLRQVALLASVVTALGACQPMQQLCENSDPNWTTRPNIAEMAVDVLVVKKTGKVVWSGKKFERQDLNTFIHQKAMMSPTPILLLRHEHGASCSQVNEIRTLIETTLDCASGQCAEGAEWDSIPDEGLGGLG